MSAKNEKYIIITEQMNGVGLSPIEKLAYALVCGFCRSENGFFHGKNAYLQEWLECTKPTLIGVMKSLEEKGLIIKNQQVVDGKMTNTYTAVEVKKFYPKGLKNLTKGVKKFNERGKEILPQENNKENNIKISTTTSAHAREIDQIIFWLVSNQTGTESLLKRNNLISAPVTQEEMKPILLPYVEEYFIGELESGKGNIDDRGRLDVLGHFAKWLPKYLRKKQEEKEKEELVKPITTKKNGFNKQEFLEALD